MIKIFFFFLFQLCVIYQANAVIPDQSREMQVISLQGYKVSLDNDPPWSWKIKYDKQVPVFVAHTPENYYPTATVNIRYHNNVVINDAPAEINAVARSAIKEALKYYEVDKTEIKKDLIKVNYNQLNGYEFNAKGIIQGEPHDIKIVITKNEHGKILSFLAYTRRNKMNHIQPAITRILNGVSFLRKF